MLAWITPQWRRLYLGPLKRLAGCIQLAADDIKVVLGTLRASSTRMARTKARWMAGGTGDRYEIDLYCTDSSEFEEEEEEEEEGLN